jgi:hypothetical protein
MSLGVKHSPPVPSPVFTYTHAMVSRLASIAAAREVILHARLVPKWEVSIRREGTSCDGWAEPDPVRGKRAGNPVRDGVNGLSIQLSIHGRS